MNFKQQPVTIVKDDMGNTIRVSKNNAEYSHIRLVQEKTMISQTGWLQKKSVSTLIHGKTEDLQKSGIGKLKKLPGNIVITESTTAFKENNPDRDLKYAGQTGVVCCSHGEPIYRKTVYDAIGEREDQLVAHTNGDAIREANIQNQGKLTDHVVNPVEDESMVDEEDSNQVDLEDVIAEVETEAAESKEEEIEVKETPVEEVIVEDQAVEVEDNVFNL